MGDRIIYFDYCGLVLLLVLLITTFFRKMTRGKVNRYFIIMVVVMLICNIADIISLTLDQMGPGHILGKHIGHFTYLLFHSGTLPCYIAYLFALTDTWHLLHKNRLKSSVVFLPFGIVVGLLFVNFFTPVMYYFDENDSYTRGSLFVVLYAAAVFYMIYGIAYMYKFQHLFNFSKFVAVIAIFPIVLLVTMIQYFAPEFVLEMFACAIAVTYISMMVQRPEELMDNDTGLGKFSAYVSAIRNGYVLEKPVEIIMLNIANYDSAFDMMGYEGMNNTLANIARQLVSLNKNMGVNAELYYLGQGKFRIVVEALHFDKTEELAVLINRAMKPGMVLNQMEINLVTNICIARCPQDIENVDDLLAFGSDLNTIPYTGKVLYAADIFRKEHYDIMRGIDRIMEQALAEHRFEVYYQPIYSVEEQRFNSAEALLRLHDDKYGFISPEIFIPAAEKSGAIHKIGAFVMEEVCSFIGSEEYKKLGVEYIEVNLSVSQCMQNNLAKDILATMDLYGVKPSQINLEITETAASYSQNAMMENIRKLTEAGVSFSLDDFGTGYSNMKRIASLPLHIVKLDKSFTDIEENPKMLIVLENTIRMIKNMNMKIVVEGVETEMTAKQFSDLACEYIQGYYFSRPIPKPEFIEFIQDSVKGRQG